MQPKSTPDRNNARFTLNIKEFFAGSAGAWRLAVSLVLLILLVGSLVGGTLTAMAQPDPTPTPAAQTQVASTAPSAQPAKRAQTAPAGQIQQAQTSLRFQHFDTTSGLPDEHVEALLQDHTGFLWFGTWGGLVRYDGYHFTVYKHDITNPNSLNNDSIIGLAETQDGMIWILTRGGKLNRFDPVSQKFTLFNLNANAFAQDRQGQLWVSTAEGRFGRLDPQTGDFQTQTLASCASADPLILLRKIMVDPESGALWMVGTNLYRFDPATLQSTCYTPPQATLPAQNQAGGQNQQANPVPVMENGLLPARFQMRLTDVVNAEPGALWLAGSSGLFKFDKASGNFTNFHLTTTLPGAVVAAGKPQALGIVSVYQDKEGTLWLGADGPDGIYKFDPQSQQLTAHYATDPANPDSYAGGPTWSIIEDREGLLWFGTVKDGVNMLDRHQSQFTFYRHDPLSNDGLPGTPIQALYQEPGGKIWIGSNTELTSFDPQTNTFQHFLVYSKPIPPVRPEALAISAFFPDDHNGLWFDGIDGLYRFDRQTTQTQVYRADGVMQGSNAAIETDSLVQDSRKNFWLLSKNVLYYFDTASLKFTRSIPVKAPDASGNPKDVTVRVVYMDKQGSLWVAGLGFLGQMDPASGQFKGYFNDPANPKTIPAPTANAIFEDSKGNLWLPSQGGLVQFDRQAQTFKLYTDKDGLPSNNLFGMLADDQGNFWISSSRGLTRFDPASGVIRNYDTTDGLQGNEFNAYSFLKNDQGEMFFGGENGLTRFTPSQIVESAYKPPVILTGMELFNHAVVPGADSVLKQPVWMTPGISLNYNQNFVSFEFAALSFAAPKNNHYRYRLEGLETDWKEVDSSTRSVNYANLQPGEYVFRVQGSNAAGVWSDREVYLKVIVMPPWWDTWLFKLPLIVVILELLIVFFRWWSHRVERRNRHLEALIEERTKELAIAMERAEAANLELQRLSVLDELTQIANRRRFDQYLFAQWEYSNRQPVSLLLCDVDFFKHYNDNHGHQAGDQCLYLVAQAVSRAVGYTKDLVARFGGEEFAVILPETDTMGALQVARMIQLEIQKLNVKHGFSEVNELVTLSIGVATIIPTPDNSVLTKEEPKLLISAADTALYQAKGEGRNRISVSHALSEEPILL